MEPPTVGRPFQANNTMASRQVQKAVFEMILDSVNWTTNTITKGNYQRRVKR